MSEEIRLYANYVLQSIEQATLTDAEASFLPNEYSESLILNSLASVINSRGATGNAFKKLRAFATLEGVDISKKQEKRSDILVGAVLE